VTAVVADASPLIAFAQIGQLHILQALFPTLAVPPVVAREIVPSVPSQPWIVERALAQPIPSPVLQASLGAGETEAISLALELEAGQLLVDDRAARLLAEGLGLMVIGTLGVLLAAKRKGLITAVRPMVDALLERNFWISPQLVDRALAEAGEEARP
jgi:predicted nucleic acid-binding protein